MQKVYIIAAALSREVEGEIQIALAQGTFLSDSEDEARAMLVVQARQEYQDFTIRAVSCAEFPTEALREALHGKAAEPAEPATTH